MQVQSRHLATAYRRAMRGIAITLVAALPATARAQVGSDAPGAISAFSTFYLATGTLLMDVSKLNPHFERIDLPSASRPGFFTISNDGYSVGMGGYGPVFDRFLLGAEFHTADLGQESSPTGKTNQITTRYWTATAGWALYTGWRVNVAPYVGIGQGTVDLILKSGSGGTPIAPTSGLLFDDIIMAPGTKSVMKGAYVMVQPGLAIDYLALRQQSDRLGLTIGVRFSTAISPNRTTWTYGGHELFGGPDVGPSGGNIRVVMGIGGFRLAGR
jgi:hypothetical protein